MAKDSLPGEEIDVAMLLSDENTDERHELLVDLFGSYLMWMRNRAIDSTKELASFSESREKLGRIHREPFDQAAQLSSQDLERAIELSMVTVDSFAQLFLKVLAHRGIDFSLGKNNALRFRLDMEIIEKDTEEIVYEDTINRDCEKHFGDYWGRWLNRYGKQQM